MRDTNRQLESRFSQVIAQALVRMWPPESRDWGKALTSELSEIESRKAAFFWLIGGVMLLFRERWRHFWRTLGRPVGVEPGGLDRFVCKELFPRTTNSCLGHRAALARQFGHLAST